MMSKKALDATATADEPVDATAAAAAPADQAKEGGGCPVCGAAFSAADVISILPAEAEREAKRRYSVMSCRATTKLAVLLVAPPVISDGAA
jgi:hypothetical protein